METAKKSLEPISHLAQIQSLDGPITIAEKVLQKIWLRKNFLHDALYSLSNKRIKILNPGKWNQLEGPDFLNASLDIDGIKTQGDVEIHFYSKDWFAHNHDEDHRYANVVLHVILFPPKESTPPPHTYLGYCPETITLLDYLHQGLEEYALEDALLTIQNRDHLEPFQLFIQKPLTDRIHLLHLKALLRWQQKCAFAQFRLKSTSWDDACHQLTLETLGYRRNRQPMASISIKNPLAQMLLESPSPSFLFDSHKADWKLNGIRPQNHPIKRLEQYTSLLQKNPNWPSDWLALAKSLPSRKNKQSTTQFRKSHKLTPLHNQLLNNIFHDTISGTRFHTLMIDALLPLASAHLNKNFFQLWFHWFSGDTPDAITQFINHCDILDTKSQPLCNGLNQGALQLFFEGGF